MGYSSEVYNSKAAGAGKSHCLLGSFLKFCHHPRTDKYNYQGAELSWLGFDEIQQLSQENVIYLFSRLRSTTVDYKKQIVATGNPDFNSFIKDWVEFALDERGIPIRKDSSYQERTFSFHESMLIMAGFKQ